MIKDVQIVSSVLIYGFHKAEFRPVDVRYDGSRVIGSQDTMFLRFIRAMIDFDCAQYVRYLREIK